MMTGKRRRAGLRFPGWVRGWLRYRARVLFVATDPVFSLHDTGRGHPERAARLVAVHEGIERAGLADALIPLPARAATAEELERVHPAEYLARLEDQSRRGGGHLDADTVVSADSWRAAVAAAGTGIAAIDALSNGAADAAFLALRPPGHHARASQGMGFCLLNNVAVAAAALADRQERVLIVDYDAHHGNGTQEIFYADPRVLYVSFHEWPLYPGTGRHDEIGHGDGEGATLNIPLPAGATGDVYLRALDDVVAARVESFAPTWVLISAGFDAHRADPLTGLGLSAGDYAAISERIAAWAAPGRLISFLEGGYDLDALRDSVAASLPALVGVASRAIEGEADTSGGPGATVVDAVADLWRRRETG
jgi:acetoin utilization deacetylase AcuC-like enzyme